MMNENTKSSEEVNPLTPNTNTIMGSAYGKMPQSGFDRDTIAMNVTGGASINDVHDVEYVNNMHSRDHIQDTDPHRVAAVYLHEGRLNLKLSEHPQTEQQLDMWFVLRRSWFGYIDIVMAIVYMLLALVEEPSVPGIQVPKWCIISIQCMCLATNALQIYLRYKSCGDKTRLPRGVGLQLFVLGILVADLLIYVIHADSMWHILRVFRPSYFISCQKAAEIRRVIRQIMKVCYEVIEMMIFLLFYVGLFSVSAVYLFSHNRTDGNFTNLGDAYTQLFVLITTCNYPNVMVPSYSQNEASFIFFFFFIVIGIYFILNLILAIVYKFYTGAERDKFRARYLHQRAAIRSAYTVLLQHDGDENATGISFEQFDKCMRAYRKRFTAKQIGLLFHSLNRSKDGWITLEEFYDFFEYLQLRWHRKGYSEGVPNVIEEEGSRPRTHSVHSSSRQTIWDMSLLVQDETSKFNSFVRKLIRSRAIDLVSDVVVGLQAIFLTIKASRYQSDENRLDKVVYDDRMNKVIFGFLIYFTVEILVKGFLLSFRTYVQYPWHRFDMFFTLVGWIALIIDQYTSFRSAASVVILRAFRLSSVLTMSSRNTFTDIMVTAFTIAPRIVRFAGALFCTYYVFAIIGMTFLADTVSNCSSDLQTDCGISYAYVPGVNFGHYQIINFNDIWHSYVSLFTLMVVNNWNNTMEGHTATTNTWSRAFFILFYMFTVLVVVNVFLAYVLEMFQIVVIGQRVKEKRAKQEKLRESADNTSAATEFENLGLNANDYDDDDLPIVSLNSVVEVQLCLNDLRKISDSRDQDLQRMTAAVDPDTAIVQYEGTHRTSQYTLYLVLFSDSLQKWIETEKRLSMKKNLDVSDSSGVTHGNIYA